MSERTQCHWTGGSMCEAYHRFGDCGCAMMDKMNRQAQFNWEENDVKVEKTPEKKENTDE